MAKITWKGSALLAPVPPVMVTCGTLEQPNIITVAWTGIINSTPPKTYISVRPERYSHKLIKDSGEFVINLSTSRIIRAVDFCGVRSGKNTDKFKECNLHAEAASEVSVPLLTESPLSIECRVYDIISLGSHDMFLADIVAVDVDEDLINEDGKLNLEKCSLAAYSHGSYYALGKKIGSMGFSVKKKNKKSRKK